MGTHDARPLLARSIWNHAMLSNLMIAAYMPEQAMQHTMGGTL